MVLTLMSLFLGCENSKINDDAGGQTFSFGEIEWMEHPDVKASDEADGDPIPMNDVPLFYYTFPCDSTTECDVDPTSFVSVGMDSGSVDQEMEIVMSLWRYFSIGTVYFQFLPHEYNFVQSIEIGTPLSYWRVPRNASEDELTFFYIEENDPAIPQDDEYIPIPSTVVDNVLIGEFEHFSKYAVGVLPGSD